MNYKYALILAALTFSQSALAKTLDVPSDPKAVFTILEISGSTDARKIVTKREGSSGISYSSRLYNCVDSTVKYLGSGESLEGMASSKPDPTMVKVVERSIAYYVGLEACR